MLADVTRWLGRTSTLAVDIGVEKVFYSARVCKQRRSCEGQCPAGDLRVHGRPRRDGSADGCAPEGALMPFPRYSQLGSDAFLGRLH